MVRRLKGFRWDKNYLYWGITAFCVIVCGIIFFTALLGWRSIAAALGYVVNILMPFIYGLAVAYLLTPALKLLESRVFDRLGPRLYPKDPRKARSLTRGVSLAATIFLAVLVVGLLLLMLLPALFSSLERLLLNMSSYISQAITLTEGLVEWLHNPELEEMLVDVISQATEAFYNWVQTSFLPRINELIASLSTGVISVMRSIVNLLIGVVVSVYVMYNREVFAAQGKKILHALLKPRQVQAVLRALSYVDDAFGGFFIGKLLDSAVVGVICFVFLFITGMPYAVLISVVVGITNMIPFFGPFIGAVPSAFLILMESPARCLIFVIFIIILQQVDGNIIGPKILGGTTGLTGFWVMFAIIVGGGLFGFMGMLCGVPVFSVLYAGLKSLFKRLLEKKGLSAETADYIKKTPPEPKPDKGGGQEGV